MNVTQLFKTMSTKKMTEKNIFSEQLQRLLLESGIKKNKLSSEIGVNPAYITLLAQGKRDPSEQTIKSLARYFKVSEEWLEYGTGEKDKSYVVTTIYEPEIKKDVQSPIVRAIHVFVEAMTPEEQEEELQRLMKQASASRTTVKS